MKVAPEGTKISFLGKREKGEIFFVSFAMLEITKGEGEKFEEYLLPIGKVETPGEAAKTVVVAPDGTIYEVGGEKDGQFSELCLVSEPTREFKRYPLVGGLRQDQVFDESKYEKHYIHLGNELRMNDGSTLRFNYASSHVSKEYFSLEYLRGIMDKRLKKVKKLVTGEPLPEKV